MKSKLKIILPVLLLVVGGVYKFVLAKPPVVPKKKIDGEVYVMPKDFLINLADGKFAKVDVGFVFKKGFTAVPVGAKPEAAVKPPDGYGALPQEAAVRDIVTDQLTGQTAKSLTVRVDREKLKKQIARAISKGTDVKVDHVLFMDMAVQ
jgi:flagellar basal body-associated protein FliL